MFTAAALCRTGGFLVARGRPLPVAAVYGRCRSNTTRQRWFSSTEDNRSFEEYFKALQIHPSFHDEVLGEAKKQTGSDNLTVASLSEALGGDEAVVLLAKSIQKQRRKEQKKRRSRRVDVILQIAEHQKTYSWKYGESLLDLVDKNRTDIELSLKEDMQGRVQGSCGGQMACSTCQVYLDEVTFAFLPPPTEAEQDMLGLAFEPQSTSRLGCQVKLNDELVEYAQGNKIHVFVPSEVNDQWLD
ncbi:2Fe-2S ferredoxin [Seminavis robusta]|uniref:2Fe-2S ferredoxin n=1 Tax=Seminavis robusta TaxID=568900 RepID=A0A9N8E1E3_9STRA|nr:2Fe-2S ferredoxin [Seminavis robusta]|eukprot:Sro524_g160000.1 2Fe-2S ferredoxin (243) ;mRNA; f:34523-35251